MYQALLGSCPQHTAEESAAYQFLTERHLQAMWLEQKYFKDFKTVQGDSITVISPGIWNAEAGPDFLKAHIRIGSSEYYGDVEIHLSEESWYQHHHHIDERYDNVILHVSLWEPQHPRNVTKKNKQTLFQTYLEHCLTISHSRILKLVDLDLYPYKKFVGSGKCAQALFRTLSEEKTHAFFSKASIWRLTQKYSFLKDCGENPSIQFGAGFARALGYKQNAQAFQEIYNWLTGLPPKSTNEYLALAMKASGYFSETYKKKWQHSAYYNELKEIALMHAISFPSVGLQLNQIRPLNHPLRRLFVLSFFLQENIWSQVLQKLEFLWEHTWKKCQHKKERRQLIKNLEAVIPQINDPHWSYHYTFDQMRQTKALSLIGKDLRHTLLINVFLPFLYQKIQERQSSEELQVFLEFFFSLPALNSGKTKYLTHRFFGTTDKGKILKHAQMEQGAYQLHHDFCLHYEASCEGCPFVERYNLYFT